MPSNKRKMKTPAKRTGGSKNRAAEKSTQLAADRPAPEKWADDRLARGEDKMMRLTGFEAIEYAEKMGLAVNKHPDSLSGPRVGISVGEASGIADEDPDLIWLDLRVVDYYQGAPSSLEPER